MNCFAIPEHKNLVITNYSMESHGSSNLLKESQFQILNICQSKFDCLVFEMLFMRKLEPFFNTSADFLFIF